MRLIHDGPQAAPVSVSAERPKSCRGTTGRQSQGTKGLARTKNSPAGAEYWRDARAAAAPLAVPCKLRRRVSHGTFRHVRWKLKNLFGRAEPYRLSPVPLPVLRLTLFSTRTIARGVPTHRYDYLQCSVRPGVRGKDTLRLQLRPPARAPFANSNVQFNTWILARTESTPLSPLCARVTTSA
jgi:hypothetical protein